MSLLITGNKGDQRQWDKISKLLKEKNLSTKNSVFSRTIFQNEGKIKTFPGKSN